MSDNQDLRIAVLGVGIMGADHVDRITNKIGGARVTVVNDYSLARAEEIAGTDARGARRRRSVRCHRSRGRRRRCSRNPGPDP